MILYTSRTDTKEILGILRDNDWRLLAGPHGGFSCHDFAYALDNGMAQQVDGRDSGVQHRVDWDPARYERFLERLGPDADWAVVPDVVADGARSMARTMAWLSTVRRYTMPLIAVQDGMEPGDVWPLLGHHCGIFIGGSTEWKWSSLPEWGKVAKRRGCYLHVGRVNSAKRILLCREHGVHSCDGRCALIDRDRIPRLTAAARGEHGQETIWRLEDDDAA